MALQQIKDVRRTYDWSCRISVRQSTVSNTGSHCRALVMVSSSIRLTAWLQIQRSAERQRDWCGYRVTIILAYIRIIVCLSCGLLIITVITPLPTKPSATKCQRTEAGERGNYWHADASAWCCCARCKYIGELADAKAENDAYDDVAAGRRRLHIKAVCQSVREATTASGVDNAASPDWQIPPNGLFQISERGWSLCKKQLEANPEEC